MANGPATLGPLSLPTRVVRERPLVARFEQSSVRRDRDSGTAGERFTGVFVRDGSGQTREEYFEEDGEPFIVKIHDPATGIALMLNPGDRTGYRIRLNSSAEELGGGFLFPFPRIDEVGEEDVLGYRCARYSCLGDSAVEATGRIWVAEDLGLVMREDIASESEIRFWRVVSMEIGEPGAEAFEAPKDYLVLESEAMETCKPGPLLNEGDS